jgi:hypothetical protein
MKPESLPEFDTNARMARRYKRPRTLVSWPAVLMGLAIGIGVGLFYTWALAPVEEFNTRPWQLRAQDRSAYIVAIMLEYGRTGDLGSAVSKLTELRPSIDPIQEVADTACELASSGYANSSSGLRAIRALMVFYRLQARTGCADALIIADSQEPPRLATIEVPTPTLAPPATKTATPDAIVQGEGTPTLFIVPTSPPRSDYEIVNIPTLCSLERPNTIVVNVVDNNGQGIPGQLVRVRWDGGESIFATGLKPELGAGYADFTMESETSYVVDMPGLSDPSQPLTATSCALEDGSRSIISFRVVFRPVF